MSLFNIFIFSNKTMYALFRLDSFNEFIYPCRNQYLFKKSFYLIKHEPIHIRYLRTPSTL